MGIQAGPAEQDQTLAVFVESHLRRNFAALVADYGLFGLGLSFASSATVLPAFAEHLGASNLVIGAISAVMTLGYALPPLFSANYTERLPRKLGFLLRYTTLERLPLLLLAGAAYSLADTRPGLVLALLLLALLMMSGIGGALTPAWMDLIGKVIPTTLRGRLFAVSGTVGAGLGVVGASLSGYYLSAYPFPLNYSLCFATGFLCLVGSYGALACSAEPALASDKPEVGLGTYLRRVPGLLARDRNFSVFLVSRGVAIVGAMGNGFYTVFALRSLGAPEWEVARFTVILLGGQAVAGFLFGYLADHAGHKPVLVVGTVAVVLGNVLAIAAGTVAHVYGVFVLVSVGLAAVQVSSLMLSMEFAPQADRPTYVGLASTLTAPVALLAPLAAGLLADGAGYRAVFGAAGLAAALSAAILAWGVRDPRRWGNLVG